MPSYTGRSVAAFIVLAPLLQAQTPGQPPYEACKPGEFTVIAYPNELWPKRDARFRVLIDRRFQGEFLTPERVWMPSIESAIGRFNGIAGASWSFDVESLTRANATPFDGALTISACGYTFGCPGGLPTPPGNPPPYNPPAPPIPIPAATLAVTLVYSETGGRREILDSDIYFNPLVPFSVDPNGSQIDFESVLVHELGHALGLDHNDNCVAGPTVMESVISLGQAGRALQSPEIEGVRFLYPDGQGAAVRAFERDRSLVFQSEQGKRPKPRTVSIYGPGGWSWTAAVSAGSWLNIAPLKGTFPAAAAITVAPASEALPPGEYSAAIRITADGYAGPGVDLQVRLKVTSQPSQTKPYFTRQSIVSAANMASTRLAPGALFTIFGAGLANSTATAIGFPLPTSLAGAEVLMNGAPAALIYVSPAQINGQAPPELAPGLTPVLVRNGAAQSVSVPLELAPSAPELFVAANGHAIVFNQDGALNSPSSPAHRGSVVTVFLTGLGAVSPPVPNGRPAPFDPLARAVGEALAEVAGQQAELYFLGLAPGFAGLGQANLKLPEGPAGELPLTIAVAGQSSASGVISVR